MHEIILAVLCIAAGIALGLVALLSFWANAIGGVTNPSAVDLTPSLILTVLAIAGIGGGAWMLLT